jgi:hypothetical protein
MGQHFDKVSYNPGFPPQHPDLYNHDVYFLQRITHETFFDWIPQMQAQGKKIIVDMDDNLWEIPSSNLAHNHYPKRELVKVEKILSLVDGITVSTQPLKDYLSKWNPNIWLCPNHIEDVYTLKERDLNKLPRLGWAGSYTHNGDFCDKLVKHLRELTMGKKIESFTTFGFNPQYLKPFCQTEGWAAATEYMDKLNELDFEIGVIVAQNNMFNTCKSNLKFLEYSAISCASVAHSVYPYTDTMIHGENGLLIQNEKTDWRDHINFLINNPEKRIEMVTKAHDFVKYNYTYAHAGDLVLNRYKSLFDFLYKGIQPQ